MLSLVTTGLTFTNKMRAGYQTCEKFGAGSHVLELKLFELLYF